ncbi:MAG: hypothetical protein ABIA76_03685 [Candidatus Diapherotrites archaeon]
MDSKTDSWFEKLMNWISTNLKLFAAMLFLIFSVGMIYGVFVLHFVKEFQMLYFAAPPVMGIISYYNRDVALIMLVIFIAFFIIL